MATYEQKQVEVLNVCRSCKILKPPRSFHCSTCGFCVEVHDHHCPWMGTCIGLRNIRYFVCFLGFTSLHALITFIINALFFAYRTLPNFEATFGNKQSDGQEKVSGGMRLLHVANVGFCLYSFFIFIGLLAFAISMHDKAMSNVTTNESIR